MRLAGRTAGPCIVGDTSKGSVSVTAETTIALRAGGIAVPDRLGREEAEEAVRTLIRWIGDDPDREGLAGTPARVVSAFEEFFAGYEQDPVELLQRTFEEVDGYDEMVVLRDIRFESHCEHHMAPILGKAHVAYLPN